MRGVIVALVVWDSRWARLMITRAVLMGNDGEITHGRLLRELYEYSWAMKAVARTRLTPV